MIFKKSIGFLLFTFLFEIVITTEQTPSEALQVPVQDLKEPDKKIHYYQPEQVHLSIGGKAYCLVM